MNGSAKTSSDDAEPLAIIGMSCRFPGGIGSPEDLWQVLAAERAVISPFPLDRGWDPGVYDPLGAGDAAGSAGKSYVDRGGFLDDAAGFDADFFGISPREAQAMDPQQRLLLEVAWEALERSAIDPASLRGTGTGVFVGAEPRGYGPRLHEAPAGAAGYLLTGTTTSVISGRIAYLLGLHGPALTVDTSASGSLVAIHLAARALRQGDCSLALAGGVSVMAEPGNFVAFSGLRGLSPAGRCRPFAAGADGTVWSEGAGIITLERLTDARRHGHAVLAVLRGSAINSDGPSDGLTVPNGAAQEDVIRQALADAGLVPGDVDAVEAHGTGTPVGDLTEARALIAAYGHGRPEARPLLVGSVKSNLGHTQAAAGVAGVIKMVTALGHGTLPATLQADQPNPAVNWAAGRVELLTSARPWPDGQTPRRAGVSSFGLSGTNAHVILESATVTAPPAGLSALPAGFPALPAGFPAPALARPDGPAVLDPAPVAWLLSAKSAAALPAQAERLAVHVAAHPEVSPADAGWALATTRTQFAHRAVVTGGTTDELRAGLAALAAGQPAPGLVTGTAVPGGRTVFVFPGQGSQWAGMGHELAAASPAFAARLAECDRALAPYTGWSLRDVLAAAPGAPALDAADVVQPALWAVMVSLAAAWQAAGVRPDTVLGHSQGEIAAACVAGILSLDDAARVVALRSQAVAALAGGGGMLSVAAPPDAVRELLPRWDGLLSVAAVNGPAATIVSGHATALAELAAACAERELRTRPVPVDYASHSPQVEQVEQRLLADLAPVAPRPGTIPMISAMTSEPVLGPELDAGYWYASLRAPVEFDRAVRATAATARAFVEVSPHPVLVGAIGDTLEDLARGEGAEQALAGQRPATVSTLRRDDGGAARFLTSLAEAHASGVPADWTAVLPAGQPAGLPTYAFQHQRYWFGETTGAAAPAAAPADRETLATPASPVPLAGQAGPALRARLEGRPPAEQAEAVLDLVRGHASALMGHDHGDAVDAGRTFKDIGFDSVTAVELRSRLGAATGLSLPAGLIFSYPTPAALAGFIRAQLLSGAEPDGTAVPNAAGRGPAPAGEPIAIVAMSCRLPAGVQDPEGLWDLLAADGDAVGPFPADRGWNLEEAYNADAGLPGTVYARGGAFMHDAGQFDPGFFGISPREAIAMDPQQRLLLELSWEAFERAGIAPGTLRGSDTGVFVGASDLGYGRGPAPAELEGHLQTGVATSVVSGRLSYTFGLEGPSLTVDTACSSSLVALHLACQALRAGECDLALAGGVTVLSSTAWVLWFSRQRGLSPDGRCKAFSAGADGVGLGEGAVLLLVERLSDARRNGHQVLAVVRGSAVNSDGASNGLTAPSGLAQQRVIKSALASARLTADEVDVVEAHGTGTPLGDPIEAEALLATYGQGRAPGHPLWLGSVKSNIAHTEWAAGVAGVIKMVLSLQHQELPRTLHAAEPSGKVDWSAGDVRLLTEPVPWPPGGRPRRAGVSAFGISGTNAHVIIEEAPDGGDVVEAGTHAPVPSAAVALDSPDRDRDQLAGGAALAWAVSGRSRAALAAQAGRLHEFVTARPALGPSAVAWALTATRAQLEQRAVVTGRDRAELLAGLERLAAGDPGPGTVTGTAGTAGKTGYVFTGQGAQRVGMGQGLRAAYPVFAAAFDAACAGLEEHLDGSVAAVIAGQSASADPDGLLNQTVWAQAGLFAVEVALFRQLEAWGLRPAVMGGHSIGELAAAHVAGVWSLDDACAVVAARGRLMQALPPGGAMIAVEATEDRVAELLADYPAVGIAAVNGPRAVVISGDEGAVTEAAGLLAAGGSRTSRLRVSHAFHSPLMEPMLDEFARVLGSVSYATPEIPLVSGLTGGPVTDEVTKPEYWVRHVREAVRFADVVTSMRLAGVATFVEVGPAGVLSALGPQSGDAARDEAWLPALRKGKPEPSALLAAVGAVHARGGHVDWARVAPAPGGRVDLPTYAFQRQRYWLAADSGPADAAGLGQAAAGHPLLGAAVDLPDGGGLVLTGRLSVAAQPWLADHVVAGQVIVPGAALVELASRAADEAGCGQVEELVIEAPLVLRGSAGVQLRVTAAAEGSDGAREAAIYSRPEADAPDGPWTRHAAGTLAPAPETAPGDQPDLRAWPPAGAERLDVDGFYDALAAAGLAYGPAFTNLRGAWRRDTPAGPEVYAEVALDKGTSVAGFGLHPALLDAALHAIGLRNPAGERSGLAGEAGPLLPFAWSEVAVHAAGATAARVLVAPAKAGDGVSVTLADDAGALVASVGGLALREASAADLGAGAAVVRDALFEPAWVPAPAPADAARPGLVAIADGAGAARLTVPGAVRYASLRAVADAVAAGADVPALVLWPVPPPADALAGPSAAHAMAGGLLETLRDWLADERLAGARLVAVTERAVDAGPETPVDVRLAPAAGLVRVAQSEHPDRLILADADDLAAAGDPLVTGAGLGEPEFAVRGGQLRVPRLGRVPATLAVPGQARADGGWRLDFTERGSLGNLVLAPVTDGLRPLGPGEVRVGIRAAGVNFRDVLNVLGMYPGEAGLLGLEGAGVVLETGADVTGLTPGDRVMGLFTGAFRPVAVTDARLLTPVPAGWSLAQAAAAPVVFLTAYYALVELAALRRGESILIHAAAGGVGIAAVQLARHLGAEVFATASPGKWPAVRALGVPDDHIASSRTTAFEEAFRAVAGGQGVDVVLDSLAGEFVDASLRLAGPGGRFIEMGKTDVRDPAAVAAAHGGLFYRAFDLLTSAPDDIAAMLAALRELFADGALVPLPAATWDVRRAPDAFRHLSGARNVGKVVLTIPAPVRPGGTALVTGAPGALGGLTARHLAASHDHLLLASRRGPGAPGASTLAAALSQAGADVTAVACDAADRDALAAVIAAIPARAPLTTVIHAAGLLDDGVLAAQTASRLDAVLRPKADGAWNLHELTSGLDLSAFVLFSSVAGILGSPGQATYAAANTFLDTLAATRRRAGLPAVSLAWGPWQSGGGMAGQLDDAHWQRMGRQGLRPLTDRDGMALLTAAAQAPAALQVPARLDLGALASRGDLPPLLSRLGRPARRARSQAGGTAGGGGPAALTARLAGLPPAERDTVLQGLVQAQAALVLGMTGPDGIEAARTFRDIGFDSLTSVELRNRLDAATGLRLPATVVFDYPSPQELGGFIGQQLGGAPVADTTVLPAFAGIEKIESSLEQLLADEAARLRVTTRLREVLALLNPNGSKESVVTAAEVIGEASDDAIFDFIDNQLGL